MSTTEAIMHLIRQELPNVLDRRDVFRGIVAGQKPPFSADDLGNQSTLRKAEEWLALAGEIGIK